MLFLLFLLCADAAAGQRTAQISMLADRLFPPANAPPPDDGSLSAIFGSDAKSTPLFESEWFDTVWRKTWQHMPAAHSKAAQIGGGSSCAPSSSNLDSMNEGEEPHDNNHVAYANALSFPADDPLFMMGLLTPESIQVRACIENGREVAVESR